MSLEDGHDAFVTLDCNFSEANSEQNDPEFQNDPPMTKFTKGELHGKAIVERQFSCT